MGTLITHRDLTKEVPKLKKDLGTQDQEVGIVRATFLWTCTFWKCSKSVRRLSG